MNFIKMITVLFAGALLQGCASITVDNFEGKPKSKITFINESKHVVQRPIVFVDSKKCKEPLRLLSNDIDRVDPNPMALASHNPVKALSFIPANKQISLYLQGEVYSFRTKLGASYEAVVKSKLTSIGIHAKL